MRGSLILVTAVTILCLAKIGVAAEIVGPARVVDGDTVEISNVKIRLIGIDAPESDQLCLNGKGEHWACGIEARDRLLQKTDGKKWACRGEELDRYGRTLATCFVDGEDVNRWMVSQGWALAFVRYSSVYEKDEKLARESLAGLWVGAFVAPWDWRSRSVTTVILGAFSVPVNAQKLLLSAVSQESAPNPDCVIKGNMSRNGECIYHVPGGLFYSRLQMDAKGRRWFCTEVEAQAAGCRKSLR